jgi:hypothetical protein
MLTRHSLAIASSRVLLIAFTNRTQNWFPVTQPGILAADPQSSIREVDPLL